MNVGLWDLTVTCPLLGTMSEDGLQDLQWTNKLLGFERGNHKWGKSTIMTSEVVLSYIQ